MKKIIISISLLVITTFAFSQAKKPTIMVLPSDPWCFENGYKTTFDNQGTKKEVPNYQAAFQNNADLLLVVGKIGDLFADRGFPLKRADQELKSLENEAAENNMLTSKSGASTAISPVELLKQKAKADIIIQITWKVNTTGPKKSVTFSLDGIDAYTNKQIAGARGTGAPSFSAELPVLLEEAVLSHIDNFAAALQKFFDDMFANGREITIRVKKFDSWADDLETEIDGKEIGSHIEDWLAKNTVKGRFNTTDMGTNSAYFEQVRIPLYDVNGKAIDARGFAKDLQKYLSGLTKVPVKLMTSGLGQATLVIGEK
jgi:hypothetical protein